MGESKFSILCMTLGMVETNCYLVWNQESKEALLIDPADSAPQIEKVIRERELTLKALLLTHGHFDHVLAADELREAFGVPLCAAAPEAETLNDPELNGDARFMRSGLRLKADRLFTDGEKVDILGTDMQIIFTPGHTRGSCCYYFPAEQVLFSGDTLFQGSFGRVDLPGGDLPSLKKSLDKLFALPEDTLVLPGHMGETSIGEERKSNPIFYY